MRKILVIALGIVFVGLGSGLDISRHSSGSHPTWRLSFASPALAQFVPNNCEYPPTDEPDNDGDECNPNYGSQINPPKNQGEVGGAIQRQFNSLGTLPTSPNFLPLFGLTGNSLLNALSQLSGEAATDAGKGATQMMSSFLDVMTDQGPTAPQLNSIDSRANTFAPEHQTSFSPGIALAYASVFKAPPQQRISYGPYWTVWGTSFGGYNKTNGDPVVAGTNDVTARFFGFAAGADYHFTPQTLAGFALSGGGTKWGLSQGLGGGRSDSVQAGLYAKTFSGPIYLAASIAFANHSMITDRIAFAGDQLAARFKAQSYGGRIEGGYRFEAMPMLSITPYAALQAQSFHTPSYNETDVSAGGFALSYNAANYTNIRSEFGTRIEESITSINGMPLWLRGRFAWVHSWVSDPSLAASFVAMPGSNFIVSGAAAPTDSALASLGAELRVTQRLSLSAKFDAEISDSSRTYAGRGVLRYTW